MCNDFIEKSLTFIENLLKLCDNCEKGIAT